MTGDILDQRRRARSSLMVAIDNFALFANQVTMFIRRLPLQLLKPRH